MNDEKLIQIALDCGATRAVVIGQDDIVLNASFRAMCEANSCGVYGRCYTCPPDVGPIDELMARVRGYEKGLFYLIFSNQPHWDREATVEQVDKIFQRHQWI